jgi:unsaturated chondroitin disaccharide hydrolase
VSDLVAVLTGRVRSTVARAAGRVPFAADRSGEWTWSEPGSWSSGYWSGLLRLAGLPPAADALIERASAPTVLRGMMFWYGIAAGSPPSGPLADAAAAAARSLAATAVGGLIPAGSEDTREYGWRPGAAVIDGLPGLVPLLAWAADRTGDPGLRDLAVGHAARVAALCVRPDGSVAQSATADGARLSDNGSSPDSTWGRAQSWGMLGLAQAAAVDPALGADARRVADWWLAHVPADLISYWDFDDPAIPAAPRDSSASAIAAAALATLGGSYAAAAARVVAALAGRLGPAGGLVDGTYGEDHGVELVWGDYFLLETALSGSS